MQWFGSSCQVNPNDYPFGALRIWQIRANTRPFGGEISESARAPAERAAAVFFTGRVMKRVGAKYLLFEKIYRWGLEWGLTPQRAWLSSYSSNREV